MDTNVPVVANGAAAQAGSDCVVACIDALATARRDSCFLLDTLGLIIGEYRRNLRPAGQPGVGDAFFKWLWDNQGHKAHCRRIPIQEDAVRGFVEFPDHPDLEHFDPDDRKFVAVALASGMMPPVLNASDPDWWQHRVALRHVGVEIVFLCPELIGDG